MSGQIQSFRGFYHKDLPDVTIDVYPEEGELNHATFFRCQDIEGGRRHVTELGDTESITALIELLKEARDWAIRNQA